MNSLIGLGVFGTFGQPFGFQQTFYLGADFKQSLDLDENVIEVYPGHELYSVKRELVDGVYTIAFCIYSYVKELYSDRIGTFIGTTIVLRDGYADAEYIYKLLRELHTDTLGNTQNIEDNTIKVQQAQNLVVREPEGFVAVRANVIPISKTPFYSTHVDTIKKLLVLPDDNDRNTMENKVVAFFDEALKYYNDVDTLYFTFDDDVVGYASKKGFVLPVSWVDFMAYKNRRQQQAVVRTKKGIHRHSETVETVEVAEVLVAPPVEYSVAEEKVVLAASGNGVHAPVASMLHDEPAYKNGHAFEDEEDDVIVEDPGSDDPNKPFDRWEEPAEPWTKSEIKYRVREYNRLFNYTNSLLEHIYTNKKRRAGNKDKGVKIPPPVKQNTNSSNNGSNKKSLKRTFFGSKRRRGVFLLVIAGIACLGAGVYNFFFNKSNQAIVSKNNVISEPAKQSQPVQIAPPPPVDTAKPKQPDSMAVALAQKQAKDEQRRKDSIESLQATARQLRSTINKAVGKSAALMANDKAQAESEQKKVLPEPYVPEEEPKTKDTKHTVKTVNKKPAEVKPVAQSPAPPPAPAKMPSTSPNVFPIKKLYSTHQPTVAAAPAKPAEVVPATVKKTSPPLAAKQPAPAPVVAKQPTVAAATNTVRKVTQVTRTTKSSPAAPAPSEVSKNEYPKSKDLRPMPNFEMTQKDIAAFSKSGVKNKTVEEIVKTIFDNVPTNVGNVYRGQEADYIAMFLNTNKQSFQKVGGNYVCTSDYAILHIPAYKSPRLPVVFPK